MVLHPTYGAPKAADDNFAVDWVVDYHFDGLSTFSLLSQNLFYISISDYPS
jgi:hypothetical protein